MLIVLPISCWVSSHGACSPIKNDLLLIWNILFLSLSNKHSFGKLVKKKTSTYCIHAASCGPHSLSSLLKDIARTDTCIPFYKLPSYVCPWTRIIDAHNIFPCIPIDPLIETSLICSLLLDIFFPSPVSFFSKLWQAVQILAVCCSPLILRQTFLLLHKYTRISEKMQSDIRWSQKHSSLWYTVLKWWNWKKKSASSLGYWVDIKMMMTVFWHWKIIENPSPLQSASWHVELIVTQETTKKDQEGIPFKMYRYLILMDIRQPVFPWPLEIIMQRLASCRSRLPQKVSSQI